MAHVLGKYAAHPQIHLRLCPPSSAKQRMHLKPLGTRQPPAPHQAQSARRVRRSLRWPALGFRAATQSPGVAAAGVSIGGRGNCVTGERLLGQLATGAWDKDTIMTAMALLRLPICSTQNKETLVIHWGGQERLKSRKPRPDYRAAASETLQRAPHVASFPTIVDAA